MARQPKPFKLTAAEYAAIGAAISEYRKLRDISVIAGYNRTQPELLGELRKALSDLIKVMDTMIKPNNPEMADVIAHIRNGNEWLGAGEPWVNLNRFYEDSLIIERAARSAITTGRPADRLAERWVLCAANHWIEAGMKVSGGERSRFMGALADVTELAADVPTVGREQVRRVLKTLAQGG